MKIVEISNIWRYMVGLELSVKLLNLGTYQLTSGYNDGGNWPWLVYGNVGRGKPEINGN